MSKTIRFLMPNTFTGKKEKKRGGEAAARLHKTRHRDTTKLFKREVAFTTWLERTSKDD
jgi:hypothetical protein